MSDQIGLIILGAGKAGRQHAFAAQRVSTIKLLGFYDTVQNASESAASEFNATSFSDLDDAFDHPGANIALIATPPGTHGELALKALEADLHVLIEKPFDTALGMIAAVQELAQCKGLQAGAIAQHRFADDVVMLQQVISRGLSGNVLSASVHVQRYRPPEYFQMRAGNWRQSVDLMGGGVLITIGFHYLDLACWMLGPATDARGRFGEESNGIELAVVGTFNLNNVPCSVHARWGEVPNAKDKLQIVTSEQSIELIGDRLVGNPDSQEVDRFELHARQLRDFASAIVEGRSPLVTPLDVEPPLRLVQELYETARGPNSGQAIKRERQVNV